MSDELLVEVRCPSCGWFMLVPPGTTDKPCGCVANQVAPGTCPGTVSEPRDRTFECVPQGFRKRVVAVLREIEFVRTFNDEGDELPTRFCPSCEEPHTRDKSRGVEGHDDDCALAALIRECEA